MVNVELRSCISLISKTTGSSLLCSIKSVKIVPSFIFIAIWERGGKCTVPLWPHTFTLWLELEVFIKHFLNSKWYPKSLLLIIFLKQHIIEIFSYSHIYICHLKNSCILFSACLYVVYTFPLIDIVFVIIDNVAMKVLTHTLGLFGCQYQ